MYIQSQTMEIWKRYLHYLAKKQKDFQKILYQKYIDNNYLEIPMRPTLRSLNLANSVAIVAYEIMRQEKFEGLEEISKYFD